MKRYGIIAVLLIGLAAAGIGQVIRATGQFTKTNSDVAVPVAFTNATVLVKQVVFLGKKAPRTDNTGVVYIGEISGNDVNTFALQPGGEAVLAAPEGSFINLALWYVDVTTANDGVTVMYR